MSSDSIADLREELLRKQTERMSMGRTSWYSQQSPVTGHTFEVQFVDRQKSKPKGQVNVAPHCLVVVSGRAIYGTFKKESLRYDGASPMRGYGRESPDLTEDELLDDLVQTLYQTEPQEHVDFLRDIARTVVSVYDVMALDML